MYLLYVFILVPLAEVVHSIWMQKDLSLFHINGRTFTSILFLVIQSQSIFSLVRISVAISSASSILRGPV